METQPTLETTTQPTPRDDQPSRTSQESGAAYSTVIARHVSIFISFLFCYLPPSPLPPPTPTHPYWHIVMSLWWHYTKTSQNVGIPPSLTPSNNNPTPTPSLPPTPPPRPHSSFKFQCPLEKTECQPIQPTISVPTSDDGDPSPHREEKHARRSFDPARIHFISSFPFPIFYFANLLCV